MPIRDLSDWTTAGGIVASLQKGVRLKTDVSKPGAAGPVYLEEGDETCFECGCLITGDHYPGAGYGNLLGNQKLKYGDTACPEHLEDLREQAPDGDWHERREHY